VREVKYYNIAFLIWVLHLYALYQKCKIIIFNFQSVIADLCVAAALINGCIKQLAKLRDDVEGFLLASRVKQQFFVLSMTSIPS